MADYNLKMRNVKKIRKFNMFIIRELFQFIALEKNADLFDRNYSTKTGKNFHSINDLYLYLFFDNFNEVNGITNIKEYQDKYTRLSNTPKIIDTIAYKLTLTGISPAYITSDNKKIKKIVVKNKALDDMIEDSVEIYHNTRPESPKSQKSKKIDLPKDVPTYESIHLLFEIRTKLIHHLSDFENLDGSLLIDSIKLLVLESKKFMTNMYNSETVGNKLSNIHFTDYYSISSVKEIYSSCINQLLNGVTQPDIPDIKKIDKSKSNIGITKEPTENIAFNFILIRGLYLLLADLDDIGNALEKFYKILDISKDEYDSIINTQKISDMKIIDKLISFNFPASIFHKRTPALLPMRTELKLIIENYFYNNKEDVFIKNLTIEMLYFNSEKNALTFMLVYNILKAVKDSEDSVDIDWINLINKYPELYTKEFKL